MPELGHFDCLALARSKCNPNQPHSLSNDGCLLPNNKWFWISDILQRLGKATNNMPPLSEINIYGIFFFSLKAIWQFIDLWCSWKKSAKLAWQIPNPFIHKAQTLPALKEAVHQLSASSVWLKLWYREAALNSSKAAGNFQRISTSSDLTAAFQIGNWISAQMFTQLSLPKTMQSSTCGLK